MLKTFLPKAFRSEKTPSNKGYFNLESWIQNRINDGTIALDNTGGDNLYTADGDLDSVARVVGLNDASLSFRDSAGSNIVIYEETGLSFTMNDPDTIPMFQVDLSTNTLMLGNNNGMPGPGPRAYVNVLLDSLTLGVYDNNLVDAYISISDIGEITLGTDSSAVYLDAILQLVQLGDLDRDALTPANGAVIYNSDFNELQAYINGSWVKISTEAVSTP